MTKQFIHCIAHERTSGFVYFDLFAYWYFILASLEFGSNTANRWLLFAIRIQYNESKVRKQLINIEVYKEVR